MLLARKEINFLDDIQKCLCLPRFIGDGLSGCVRRGNEGLIIGASKEEEVGVKFFFCREFNFINEWTKFFKGGEFDVIKRCVSL